MRQHGAWIHLQAGDDWRLPLLAVIIGDSTGFIIRPGRGAAAEKSFLELDALLRAGAQAVSDNYTVWIKLVCTAVQITCSRQFDAQGQLIPIPDTVVSTLVTALNVEDA